MTVRTGSSLFTPQYNSPEAGKDGELFFVYTGTATSGDTIVFSGDPTAYLPAGAILVYSELLTTVSKTAMTASVGYQSTDGDVVTTNATNTTYFDSAQSVATAGRLRPASLYPPIEIPKNAWAVVTIGGANMPQQSIYLRVVFQYPGPPPSQR